MPHAPSVGMRASDRDLRLNFGWAERVLPFLRRRQLGTRVFRTFQEPDFLVVPRLRIRSSRGG